MIEVTMSTSGLHYSIEGAWNGLLQKVDFFCEPVKVRFSRKQPRNMRTTQLLLVLASFGFILSVLAEEHKCLAPPESSTYASEPHGFFPTTFHDAPVLAIKRETHDSNVITFGLPEGVSLELPISSAIMLNAPGVKDGKDVARPYNPISPNSRLCMPLDPYFDHDSPLSLSFP